ncbi:retinol-binding protein pinta-like [Teleopsis dalmanni]|uniref:retinol-binding protein pinta-like n=1 Tax=Teleopsis dalmanni TaxID=139649 RepID=UPI000D329670|nr:retinol-binding protein pinta-like [Teleopsis dalmanni]
MNPTSKNEQPTIRPLSPMLQEIAIKELNEVPHRLHEDILTLRKWIYSQPHLRARTNDQFLLSFLRGSKFSLEKAKQKIDRYYSLKAAIPEIFNEHRNVDDKIVMDIIRAGIILQIPLAADDTRPCITIIRAGSYDTKIFKFADIIRVGTMFGEILMIEDDNASVSGYIEIMDMNNVTAAHFFQLKPDLLRKFSVFADEAMPTRQRGTHFINVPPPFEKGFSTLKNFFPAKMLSRISVSSDSEAIFNFVPRNYLPIEYGGENGTMQDIINNMEEKIMKYREYFLDDSKYGTDEKLREGTPINYESYFGIEGSFRKLDID